jgi:hypothetical protein
MKKPPPRLLPLAGYCALLFAAIFLVATEATNSFGISSLGQQQFGGGYLNRIKKF